MTLLNAPQYNQRREQMRTRLLIGSGVTVVVLVLVAMLGFLLGHGWFFMNLPVEHRVDTFFNALEAKDYEKAYSIWTNDPDWKQHTAQHANYPFARFKDDWTTDTEVYAPITSHKVEISKSAGDGTFGSGLIVRVKVNGLHTLYMWYERKDGTLTEPAPYELHDY